MSDLDREMLGDFLAEAREQRETLSREFVALEAEPENLERITTIFRVMHTLKGAAGFLSFEQLESVAHFSETLLSRLRSGELAPSRERIDLLLAASDAIACILTHVERDGNEGPPAWADLLVALKRAAEAPSEKAHDELRELEELQAQLMRNLDQEPQPPAEDRESANIVVVVAEGTRFGLIVDGVSETGEIVVKPLSRELKQLHLYAGATIMGDGRIALILDVAGLARAGRLHEHAEERGAEGTERGKGEEGSSLQSMLLFRLDDREQFAVPLTLVSRIEKIPVAQTEWSSGQRLFQYRGKLLQLIDLARELGRLQGEEPETLSVLVFEHRGREVGLVVGEILDVVVEPVVLQASGAPGSRLLGTAVLQGRASSLIDLCFLLEQACPHHEPIGAAA